MQIMENHIQISKETIASLNSTIFSYNENIKIFEDRVSQIERLLKYTNIELLKVELHSKITAIDQDLLEETHQLEKQIDEAINAILFAKKGLIHPAIINPHALQEELALAKLPTDRIFPFPHDAKNIFQYIELCHIDSYISGSNLIFAVRIPLIHLQNFSLFRLIPLPSQSDPSTKLYHYIEPSFQFLLINDVKTRYSKLHSLEMCAEVYNGHFICKSNTLYLIPDTTDCELHLFLLHNIEKPPQNCNYRLLKAHMDIWQPIKQDKWIYILDNPLLVTIDCPRKNVEELKIRGTGIFTLEKGCKAHANGIQLSTEDERLNISYYHIIPQHNSLSAPYYLHLPSTNFTLLTPIHLQQLHPQKLQILSHKLEVYDELLKNTLSKPEIEHHNSTISLFLGVIYTIVVTLILHRLYKLFSCCFPNFSIIHCFNHSSRHPHRNVNRTDTSNSLSSRTSLLKVKSSPIPTPHDTTHESVAPDACNPFLSPNMTDSVSLNKDTPLYKKRPTSPYHTRSKVAFRI